LKTPVVIGTNFAVTNSFLGGQKFYRLSSIAAPFTSPPPILTIQTVTSNAVRLLWPVDDDRPFALESSTNLNGSSWIVGSSSLFVMGTNNVVTNSAVGPGMYYRLYIP
jgi:hypothetical protein